MAGEAQSDTQTQAPTKPPKGERAEMPPAQIHDPDPNDDQATELFGQGDELNQMLSEFAPIPGVEEETQQTDPTEDPLGLTDEGTQEQPSKPGEVVEEPQGPSEGEQPGSEPSEPAEPAETETEEETDESTEETIQRLRQRIIELTSEQTEAPSTVQPQQPETPEQKPSQQQSEQTAQQPAQRPAFESEGDVVKFVKDDDALRESFSSAENVNKLLTNQTAYTVEQVVKVIGQIIPQMMQRQFTYFEAEREFMQENPDLAPVKGYLARKVNEYQAQHPEEKDILKVFMEAGLQTRKDLALARQAAEANGQGSTNGNGKPQQPAFANPQGSRKGTPTGTQTSGIQKEIDDLIP